ncbi:type VI secretion system contractile sheath large subunit [Rhizobium straminoryzae]|uniref:Type VI secretion system contractile sheath large subunit n=1 Tax=Rhizobium straminoryzae TaxID=1387186 RepID=A0A549TFP4_9HYPH|nr:type VI secretion system contractile sheath large subunit [Rhizobium straminoryzae]TRL41326.1 type VI secretion system contractile sheath large subunit [Rhizobium straminoryzae]
MLDVRCDARRLADRVICLIDEALNDQLNAIMHHEQFQAMEARWRGLAMLVRQASRGSDVKVKLLSVGWAELARSLDRAADFDQSPLFELVYSREFGMPGGEPFGLLVADFYFSPAEPAHADPVGALTHLATMAAAAFCPIVAGATPKTVGLDAFSELGRITDFSWLSTDPRRLRWNTLRAGDDARFLGLVAPRVLMRQPLKSHDRRRADPFPFRERIGEDARDLLWGNGSFAFGAVLIRNFIESGWFADIRGVTQDATDGGFLSADELPPLDLGLESEGLSRQPPVEVRLSSAQEQQLGELGIIPIGTTYLTANAIFNSNPSLHAPPHYSSDQARQNARLAGMLQYVFCASRFSHYLKVIMRDEIGKLADAGTLERRLNDWLTGYTLGNEDADVSLRIRYPLRSAGVSVSEVAGKPGSFACTVRLQPHFQLDDISTSFHLIAEANPDRGVPTRPEPRERISA